MARLFERYALRGMQLANRIVVSPMCQYSADDGRASAWHSAHLGSMALSGAGLMFVEATAVTDEGRITPGCLGLWSDAHAAALAPAVAVIRAAAPIRLGIQLSHAGRKASSAAPWDGGRLIARDAGGWQPVAPSAIAGDPAEPPPRALAIDELPAIRAAFASAGRRALDLGFDAIELHMAHGYLLHQFLSPVANHRTDAYGGSFDNRIRFPLEVFDAVRAVFPADRPVGVRVSATDWLPDEPSWTLEQTETFAQAPGYQVPLAAAVRRASGLPTIAVGLITEPRQAEAIVADGLADLVALARGVLYDPRWAWHAAAQLGAKVPAPRQYWRAVPRDVGALFEGAHFGQR